VSLPFACSNVIIIMSPSHMHKVCVQYCNFVFSKGFYVMLFNSNNLIITRALHACWFAQSLSGFEQHDYMLALPGLSSASAWACIWWCRPMHYIAANVECAHIYGMSYYTDISTLIIIHACDCNCWYTIVTIYATMWFFVLLNRNYTHEQ